MLYQIQVIWRHEGRLLTKNDKHTLYSDNGLTIPAVTLDDRGKYYCLAANNAGSDKKITTLKVQGLKCYYILFTLYSSLDYHYRNAKNVLF